MLTAWHGDLSSMRATPHHGGTLVSGQEWQYRIFLVSKSKEIAVSMSGGAEKLSWTYCRPFSIPSCSAFHTASERE